MKIIPVAQQRSGKVLLKLGSNAFPFCRKHGALSRQSVSMKSKLGIRASNMHQV